MSSLSQFAPSLGAHLSGGPAAVPATRGVPSQAATVPGTRQPSLAARSSTITVHSQVPGDNSVTQSYMAVPHSASSEERAPLTQGDIGFVLKRTLNARDTAVIVNLTEMNEILRRGWNKAEQAIARELEKRERNGGASDLRELLETPEYSWYCDDRFSKLLSGETASGRILRYLSCDGILQEWEYFGVVKNDPSEAKLKMITMSSQGRVDTANVFARYTPTSAPLALILKRYRNPATERYEHFYFCPWTDPVASRPDPCRADTEYEDRSGHRARGRVIPVGFVRFSTDEAAEYRARQVVTNVDAEFSPTLGHSQERLPRVEAILTSDHWRMLC